MGVTQVFGDETASDDFWSLGDTETMMIAGLNEVGSASAAKSQPASERGPTCFLGFMPEASFQLFFDTMFTAAAAAAVIPVSPARHWVRRQLDADGYTKCVYHHQRKSDDGSKLDRTMFITLYSYLGAGVRVLINVPSFTLCRWRLAQKNCD